MGLSPELKEVLQEIHRENRRTRLVFGFGIIVLALTLMTIAPTVIRTAVQNSSLYDPIRMIGSDTMVKGEHEEMSSMGSATSASSSVQENMHKEASSTTGTSTQQ